MASRITISRCHRAEAELSDFLRSALAVTREFAQERALHPTMARRLAIIVEEIVTNVLCHAGSGRDIALTLGLHQDDGCVFVTLEDESIAFDPRLAPLRELPNPDRGGGVGLALVKAWTEIVSYDCAGSRNRLVLQLHPCGDPASGSDA